MTGFVYFLRCGDFVKIGYSARPKLRLRALRTACPYELEVLAQLPGTMAHEQAVHRRLKHIHHRGEWFHYCGEIDVLIGDGLPDPAFDNIVLPKTKLEKYLATEGISRSDFGLKIGVSEVAITRYIGGKRFPRREHLEAISAATSGVVSALDFLTPSPSDPAPVPLAEPASAP